MGNKSMGEWLAYISRIVCETSALFKFSHTKQQQGSCLICERVEKFMPWPARLENKAVQVAPAKKCAIRQQRAVAQQQRNKSHIFKEGNAHTTSGGVGSIFYSHCRALPVTLHAHRALLAATEKLSLRRGGQTGQLLLLLNFMCSPRAQALENQQPMIL